MCHIYYLWEANVVRDMVTVLIRRFVSVLAISFEAWSSSVTLQDYFTVTDGKNPGDMYDVSTCEAKNRHLLWL